MLCLSWNMLLFLDVALYSIAPPFIYVYLYHNCSQEAQFKHLAKTINQTGPRNSLWDHYGPVLKRDLQKKIQRTTEHMDQGNKKYPRLDASSVFLHVTPNSEDYFYQARGI